jgi:hypothetical protein
MNISEADAVATVLAAVTRSGPVDAQDLTGAMIFLEQRAAKALQVSWLPNVTGDPMREAARRLAQEASDAL